MKFNREDNLKIHGKGHLTGYKKPTNQYSCQYCGEIYENYMKLFKHSKNNPSTTTR